MARNSRISSRAVGALALSLAVVAAAETSAHRRDEYLQAARIAIDPGALRIELDLTPGIAVAEAVLSDIDRNHDGALAADERLAYGNLVLQELEVEIDGTPLRVQPGSSNFPDSEAMREGEGTIRLQSETTLPRLPVGAHHLLFRNRHDRERSVYLVNALVPEDDRIAVTAQRRDGDQSELMIDYVIRPAAERSGLVWRLIGGVAAATALSALLTRRSARRSRSGEPRVSRKLSAI